MNETLGELRATFDRADGMVSRSFACNSPCAHCMFVSVHAAESLLFGNCRRLWGGRGVSGRLGRRGRIGAAAGGVGASRAKVLCVRRWEEV